MQPALITLMIRAARDGMLLVDHQPVGILGPEEAISIPALTGRDVWLSFRPFDERCVPMDILLKWQDGMLVMRNPSDAITMRIWPQNRMDLLLTPYQIPEKPSTLLPELVCEAQQEDRHHTIIHQGDWYYVVEDNDGNVIHEYHLATETPVTAVQCLPFGSCVQADQHVWFFNQACQCLLDLHTDSYTITDEDVTATVSVPDTRSHQLTYQWDAHGLRQQVTLAEDDTTTLTAEDCARCLLEALQLGALDEAHQYLSESLQQALTPEALRDYIGPFESVCPCPQTDDPDRVMWAVVRTVEGQPWEQVTPLCFEMLDENGWHVDNIMVCE